jgi:hypothetical protein
MSVSKPDYTFHRLSRKTTDIAGSYSSMRWTSRHLHLYFRQGSDGQIRRGNDLALLFVERDSTVYLASCVSHRRSTGETSRACTRGTKWLSDPPHTHQTSLRAAVCSGGFEGERRTSTTNKQPLVTPIRPDTLYPPLLIQFLVSTFNNTPSSGLYRFQYSLGCSAPPSRLARPPPTTSTPDQSMR